MLSELKNRLVRKLDEKSSKNEKVRVKDVKIFEEIIKRCRKESSTIGRKIWKIKNREKERIFFDMSRCYDILSMLKNPEYAHLGEILDIIEYDYERNEKKGGLSEEGIKN